MISSSRSSSRSSSIITVIISSSNTIIRPITIIITVSIVCLLEAYSPGVTSGRSQVDILYKVA